MLAAVTYGQYDMRVEQSPIPETPKGSILIKVQACAICGTDLRIYQKGDHRAVFPVITGHEISGVVVDKKDHADDILIGDRVCVAPGHGCGICRMCRAGQPNVCESPYPSLGYKLNGGFAEYLAVPEHILRLGFVNKIPEELSFEQAALSEIVACCLNAQRNALTNKGDNVLIIGAGPAGIIHALLSRANGANKILMAQRSTNRFQMIKERFPDLVDILVSTASEDIDQVVKHETDGFGADVIYVCAPSREAQELGFSLLRNRGRINLFGGLPKGDSYIRIDANILHYKELFISGASSSLPETNREAIQMIASKKIDADRFITHTFPLEKIHDGFEVLQRKESLKVIIKP